MGTVSIKTPLLDHELQGAAYLASQDTNPFASPLVLYLLVHDPISGVQVKLAGTVSPDPVTGQLTSTFANTPELPFEELKLHFFDGPRASLSTPPSCGSYATDASFTPWSAGPAAPASASFAITSGAEGSGCPNPAGLAPAFNAQSTSTQAGAFTAFTLNLGHRDQDQPLSGMTIHLPQGVAAMLASLTPCPEPQASRGECGPESQIGQATAYAGLGPEPDQQTGRVYLTGPYGGAPFGLSIATPAVAGPFNLGTVVVRATINVDPNTAAVTITSAIPTVVQGVGMAPSGVPLQLKQLQVTVDRPGFEFNPTSCNKMAVTGTLTGSEGASAQVSSPFQVAGCQGLPFHPRLEVSTQGQASRANGASLTVKVTSQGLGVANIAKTKLTLPAALPSRLTTIQKACPDSVFQSTPADPGGACDEGSLIGEGIAHTPVLRAPLKGPAYLVSHGGAAFPDVEFVLKGEGILLVLDGKTDIKNGITTSEFNSVPDAPVESFEAILPMGPHSALSAYASASNPYDLCAANLAIPTVITAQNGAVIEPTTKITPQGCAAVKSSRTKKLTLAQQLAKALHACRTRYKHNHARRAACERKTHAAYTAKAMAACRATNKHSRHRRQACEAQARRQYAAHKATSAGSRARTT